MGCRILVGHEGAAGTSTEMACMYDNVTDTAFGPVFTENNALNLDAHDCAIWFIRHCPNDPRSYTERELGNQHHAWYTLVDKMERAREKFEEWLRGATNQDGGNTDLGAIDLCPGCYGLSKDGELDEITQLLKTYATKGVDAAAAELKEIAADAQ